MRRCRQRCAGFSLLELVVALLLMAILSTAFIPLVRMSQQRSAQVLVTAEQQYALQNQMEVLVSAFADEVNSGGDVVSFQPQVAGLLAAGVVLESNDFVKDDGIGGLEADSAELSLLQVSIRYASGYRFRRLFSER